MTLQIEAGGRMRVVEVTRSGGKFLVAIDGRQHEVDVKEIGGVLSLLVGRKSYEVSVEGSSVHVDGIAVAVTIVPAQPSWGRSGVSLVSEGPQQVKAPMPGKIVKLLVKPGDRVEPRQGLVVVEAMKMENELRALAGGTVSEVRVAEGSSVEAGAILVVLE